MDQVVPLKGLINLIEPHYPKGDGGRPVYPLMAVLIYEKSMGKKREGPII
ncbi:ISPssy, transposase [Pseudomonas syringae pv. aceris]|uniref:ISPssy, transposase n=1 Tax=Pseudomonas syringae pv. aceris TaxID=199198 RepID=A0A0L8IJD9_PSESX|nr:ISPssy, transposase [Pseudomonas syringae pv. aceris str. M302273]KOG01568.1 ISPssy, transposase [Pseudomonas syringae pv. aceris]KPW11627.1 ISPssy, transposase [Pseudomonas syringae pv. aceris]